MQISEYKFNADISVIIPCFNSSATIYRCLKSVSLQTLRPLEIILIDDGSTDDLMTSVSTWLLENDIPFTLVKQKNGGAPSARNAGLSLAKGTYVAFLDADDAWLPNKLEIQRALMESHELTLCGHGYYPESTNLKYQRLRHSRGKVKLNKVHRYRFLFGNPFSTPTVMVKKDCFHGFDERFLCGDDTKAWIETFEPNRCGYIDQILAVGFKPAIGHSGLSSSVYRMHKSYINVLINLRVNNTISYYFFIVAYLIEMFKYPIRISLVLFNKFFRLISNDI